MKKNHSFQLIVIIFSFVYSVSSLSLFNEYTHPTKNTTTIKDASQVFFKPETINIGIQVGHWQNEDIPEELFRIKGNSGAEARNGYTELESNMKIAKAVAAELESKGITVDLIPATVPAGYTADAFISIHADGNTSTEIQGFKVAANARDATGSASFLASLIEREYQAVTSMPKHDVITRNMTHYYAFSSHRFTHAVSSATPAVIVETGFISNIEDQELLIHQPTIPAQGIAKAVTTFLQYKRYDALLIDKDRKNPVLTFSTYSKAQDFT